MAETNVISASELFAGDTNEIFLDAGVPKYKRRLTDKILASFNHAYAIGEDDIARDLWQALAKAEEAGQKKHDRRNPNQALDLASSWVAFVDARNRYRELTVDPDANTQTASAAYQVMKNAYMAWLSKVRQT